jgi:hypothetical protein
MWSSKKKNCRHPEKALQKRKHKSETVCHRRAKWKGEVNEFDFKCETQPHEAPNAVHGGIVGMSQTYNDRYF